MKKVISVFLTCFMISSMAVPAFASDLQDVNSYVPDTMLYSSFRNHPRVAYAEAERTLNPGSKWKSKQYHCTKGDYFAGYTKNCRPSGELRISIYYSSTESGRKSKLKAGTVSGSLGNEVEVKATKDGYYSVIIENVGSSKVTTLCGVYIN